ncbi:AbgT family transporter [Bacillus sp. A301a_S52]|nr:AbgT family transporter [Bacillus sp. A301a_S52]
MKANLQVEGSQQESRFVQRLMNVIEKGGNKLPHPAMLFVYLSFAIILIFWLLNSLGVNVVEPLTDETVHVQNLMSTEGIDYILTSLISNFAGFSSLGLVLVMMLGIGLAKQVGFFETFMRVSLTKVQSRFVTYAVIFTGIIGNIASDAAVVIVPAMAAMIYYSLNRHPIAGLLIGYAATIGGFTANLIIAGTDVLLSGITTEVIQGYNDTARAVTPVANWFFGMISVGMLVVVIAFVAKKYIEPRFGEYNPSMAEEGFLNHKESHISKQQIKGLRYAALSGLLYVTFIAILTIPQNALLRGGGDSFLDSLFLSSIVPLLLGFFLIISLTYGFTVKSLTSLSDVPVLMGKSIAEMSGFIVLVFFAAQFIAYFNWTNMSTIIAVSSTNLMESMNFTGLPAVVLFIILCAVINLFVTSGSAQWALLAPVFLPIFYNIGFDPGYIQMAFRIGDSATNLLAPTSPYAILILGLMKQYDYRTGIGTLFSAMLPFAIIMLICWIILFVIWSLLGLPVGPGVYMYY